MKHNISRLIWASSTGVGVFCIVVLSSLYAARRSSGTSELTPSTTVPALISPAPQSLPKAIARTPLTLKTQQGQIEGVAEGDAIAFKGIPYAAAPLGALRWRAPQPAQSWDGVRKATAYRRACTQPSFSVSLGSGRVGSQSEDCLYLNVWAPRNPTSAKQPVMVWIHGGAFVIGASNLPLWNGGPLAQKGAVVVNLNYRLGQLGFFTHPALEQESPGGAVNFGLLDQIAALQWVKENIAAFGGDPNNVTIFGESAGGQSVLALMASPLAQGLFQKGIAQSTYGSPELTRSNAVAMGSRIASAVGLNGASATLAELRTVPAKKFGQLKDTSLSNSPVPISGDPVLPQPILSTFEKGEQARVPLIIGSTSNEASIALDFGIRPAALVQQLGALRGAVRILYPGVNDDTALGLQLARDAVFTAPARRIATLHAGTAPTWRYYFSYVPVGLRSRWVNGVPHGGETSFVMNTVDRDPAIANTLTNADRTVARQVSNYWFEFARSGKPTSANTPPWPNHSPTSDKTLEFGNTFTVRSNFMKARLDTLTALSARIFAPR